MADDKIRPFFCGTQSMDWKANNCDECRKGYSYAISDSGKGNPWRCEIEYAIDLAGIEHGEVTPEIAARMGVTDDNRTALVWRCTEFEEDIHEGGMAAPERPAGYRRPRRSAPGQADLFAQRTAAPDGGNESPSAPEVSQ